MKKVSIILTFILSFSIADDIALKKEGIGYIKKLGVALKSEMKKRMKEDKTGLVALGFCSVEANNITKKVNSTLPKYANVRRTSLKLRNSIDNDVDGIDKDILENFEKEMKNGTFKNKPKFVRYDGIIRVYKPLLTKKVCLKCHGENIDPSLKSVIEVLYPKDKATNFKEGSLRGAIVAEITE